MSGPAFWRAPKNTQDSGGGGGEYYGADINPDAGQLLVGYLARFGKILYGDSLKSLDALDKKIDLFINESDHSIGYEMAEYQMVKGKLAPCAVIR